MGLATIKAGSPDPDATTSTAVLSRHQLQSALPLAQPSPAVKNPLLADPSQCPSQSHHFLL